VPRETGVANTNDWHHHIDAVLSLFLNEFGDFPILRRMLLGLKRRAESNRKLDQGALTPVATPPG
jgi:hypothetical protein